MLSDFQSEEVDAHHEFMLEPAPSFSEQYFHKMEALLLAQNNVYKIDRVALDNYMRGDPVNILLNGKYYTGEVLGRNRDSELEVTHLIMDLGDNNGQLKLHLGKQRIYGLLVEDSVEYYIEGYGDEIILMDHYEYKKAHNALNID